jgi:hypothetical protein
VKWTHVDVDIFDREAVFIIKGPETDPQNPDLGIMGRTRHNL